MLGSFEYLDMHLRKCMILSEVHIYLSLFLSFLCLCVKKFCICKPFLLGYIVKVVHRGMDA